MRLFFLACLIAALVFAGALAMFFSGAPIGHRSFDAAHRSVGSRTERPAKPLHLRVLTEGAYPPFNFVDTRSGTLKGFDIDLARALCARMRARCTIEAAPWDRLLPALRQGRADAVIASMLIPSAQTASDQTDIIFSRAYYATPARFAVRGDSGVSGDVTTGLLDGARVAVEQGSSHEAFLRRRFPRAAIVSYRSLPAAQAALGAGRVDFLLGDAIALMIWIDGAPERKKDAARCCRLLDPAFRDPEFFGAGAGIAFASGNRALRERFNAALEAVRADGAYEALAAHYFAHGLD